MLKIRNTMHRFENQERRRKEYKKLHESQGIKKKKRSKKHKGNSKQKTQIRWEK